MIINFIKHWTYLIKKDQNVKGILLLGVLGASLGITMSAIGLDGAMDMVTEAITFATTGMGGGDGPKAKSHAIANDNLINCMESNNFDKTCFTVPDPLSTFKIKKYSLTFKDEFGKSFSINIKSKVDNGVMNLILNKFFSFFKRQILWSRDNLF